MGTKANQGVTILPRLISSRIYICMSMSMFFAVLAASNRFAKLPEDLRELCNDKQHEGEQIVQLLNETANHTVHKLHQD